MYVTKKNKDFNYELIARQYGSEIAIELQTIAKEGKIILEDTKIRLGTIFIKAKAMVKHGDFTNWCMLEYGVTISQANDYMNIAQCAKMYPQTRQILPEKVSTASAMAKAIKNTPKSNQDRLIKSLFKKTIEKDGDLTQAEIEEIAKKHYRKPLGEQLNLNIPEVENNSTNVVDIPTKLNNEYNNLERQIQDSIEGDKEVITPVGRIDVLTNTHVIEIKKIVDWKNALGQVISYGFYYPEYKKKIILFGKLEKRQFLKVIEKICNANNVEVELWK